MVPEHQQYLLPNRDALLPALLTREEFRWFSAVSLHLSALGFDGPSLNGTFIAVQLNASISIRRVDRFFFGGTIIRLDGGEICKLTEVFAERPTISEWPAIEASAACHALSNEGGHFTRNKVAQCACNIALLWSCGAVLLRHGYKLPPQPPLATVHCPSKPPEAPLVSLPREVDVAPFSDAGVPGTTPASPGDVGADATKGGAGPVADAGPTGGTAPSHGAGREELKRQLEHCMKQQQQRLVMEMTLKSLEQVCRPWNEQEAEDLLRRGAAAEWQGAQILAPNEPASGSQSQSHAVSELQLGLHQQPGGVRPPPPPLHVPLPPMPPAPPPEPSSAPAFSPSLSPSTSLRVQPSHPLTRAPAAAELIARSDLTSANAGRGMPAGGGGPAAAPAASTRTAAAASSAPTSNAGADGTGTTSSAGGLRQDPSVFVAARGPHGDTGDGDAGGGHSASVCGVDAAVRKRSRDQSPGDVKPQRASDDQRQGTAATSPSGSRRNSHQEAGPGQRSPRPAHGQVELDGKDSRGPGTEKRARREAEPPLSPRRRVDHRGEERYERQQRSGREEGGGKRDAQVRREGGEGDDRRQQRQRLGEDRGQDCAQDPDRHKKADRVGQRDRQRVDERERPREGSGARPAAEREGGAREGDGEASLGVTGEGRNRRLAGSAGDARKEPGECASPAGRDGRVSRVPDVDDAPPNTGDAHERLRVARQGKERSGGGADHDERWRAGEPSRRREEKSERRRGQEAPSPRASLRPSDAEPAASGRDHPEQPRQQVQAQRQPSPQVPVGAGLEPDHCVDRAALCSLSPAGTPRSAARADEPGPSPTTRTCAGGTAAGGRDDAGASAGARAGAGNPSNTGEMAVKVAKAQALVAQFERQSGVPSGRTTGEERSAPPPQLQLQPGQPQAQQEGGFTGGQKGPGAAGQRHGLDAALSPAEDGIVSSTVVSETDALRPRSAAASQLASRKADDYEQPGPPPTPPPAPRPSMGPTPSVHQSEAPAAAAATSGSDMSISGSGGRGEGGPRAPEDECRGSKDSEEQPPQPAVAHGAAGMPPPPRRRRPVPAEGPVSEPRPAERADGGGLGSPAASPLAERVQAAAHAPKVGTVQGATASQAPSPASAPSHGAIDDGQRVGLCSGEGEGQSTGRGSGLASPDGGGGAGTGRKRSRQELGGRAKEDEVGKKRAPASGPEKDRDGDGVKERRASGERPAAAGDGEHRRKRRDSGQEKQKARSPEEESGRGKKSVLDPEKTISHEKQHTTADRDGKDRHHDAKGSKGKDIKECDEGVKGEDKQRMEVGDKVRQEEGNHRKASKDKHKKEGKDRDADKVEKRKEGKDMEEGKGSGKGSSPRSSKPKPRDEQAGSKTEAAVAPAAAAAPSAGPSAGPSNLPEPSAERRGRSPPPQQRRSARSQSPSPRARPRSRSRSRPRPRARSPPGIGGGFQLLDWREAVLRLLHERPHGVPLHDLAKVGLRVPNNVMKQRARCFTEFLMTFQDSWHLNHGKLYPVRNRPPPPEAPPPCNFERGPPPRSPPRERHHIPGRDAILYDDGPPQHRRGCDPRDAPPRDGIGPRPRNYPPSPSRSRGLSPLPEGRPPPYMHRPPPPPHGFDYEYDDRRPYDDYRDRYAPDNYYVPIPGRPDHCGRDRRSPSPGRRR